MNLDEFDNMLKYALMEANNRDYLKGFVANNDVIIEFSNNFNKIIKKMLKNPFKYAKKISKSI